MKHCKDCKFWSVNTVALQKPWTTCERLDWVPINHPLAEDNAALYSDAGEDTGLKTGPMFGCVKFQPRD